MGFFDFFFFSFVLYPFSHHSAFGPSHALSMLSNFMGVPNLQNLPNLQHSDVLEKLKMQVGLMDPEFAIHQLRNLNTPPNSTFNMPSGNDAASTTAANQPHNLSALQTSQQKSFPFTTPNAPNTKDGNDDNKLSVHSLEQLDFIYRSASVSLCFLQNWTKSTLI